MAFKHTGLGGRIGLVGMAALDEDAGDLVNASGVAAGPVDLGGSADVEFAVDVADIQVDAEHVDAFAVDGDGSEVVILHMALKEAGLGGRIGRGRHISHVDVCGAGALDLALVGEGAVGAPVVHFRRQVLEAERGGVVTLDRDLGIIGHKAADGVFAVIGGDDGPGQRFEHVGAGDEVRGAAGLAVKLVGRMLGDEHDLGLLGLGRGSRRGCGRGRGCGRRCGRSGGGRRSGGFRNLESGGLRHGQLFGRLSQAHEHGVAVGQTVKILGVLGGEPLEAGVASLGAFECLQTGGVEFIGRDVKAGGVGVGDLADAALHQRMLDRVGLVGDHAVLHVEGALAGVDVVGGDHHVVVEQIVPGVGLQIMEGVHAVGHDVGEGLLGVLADEALAQSGAVGGDFPDLQVRAAVGRMLGGSDELKAAVVIEIGHGVVPGQIRRLLLELVKLGIDQGKLLVGIRQFGGIGHFDGSSLFGRLLALGSGLLAGSVSACAKAEDHDQCENDADETFFHFFLLSKRRVFPPFFPESFNTCMIQNESSHKCHTAKSRVFAAENCMRARFYSSKDQAISSSMAWTVSGQLYWFI